ncbi:MAG: PQQ-binding-like beta-propeller repeat protein [Planctomycetia bacterium]|jgi:outer membrane protein assembly factor BamB
MSADASTLRGHAGGWLPYFSACLLSLVASSPLVAADVPEAAAEAWPMFRGCAGGTGRSAAALGLPLEERWHRAFEKTAFEATPVIVAGTIYVGDLDGTFHALALETGTTRWTFASEAGFPASAAASTDPALPIVVVGDADGVVHALDAASGALRWEYETEGEISGGPTIVHGAEGGRLFVGSQDASLSCLDLATGRLLWKHSIADQIRCSPTVADGVVFLAGCDGKLHVIDAATGTERSAVPIGGPTGTTPAAHASRVYFGTEGGGFYAIDVAAAKVVWQFMPAANAQAYRSSAAIADGLAIVGSRGRAVEAFVVADGTRAWRQPMRGRVDGSPVVAHLAGSKGLIALVGDAAGRIAALDTATGKPAWEFDAGGGLTASPAVAAGHVVAASDDGTIWCFRSTSK